MTSEGVVQKAGAGMTRSKHAIIILHSVRAARAEPAGRWDGQADVHANSTRLTQGQCEATRLGLFA